MGQYLENRPEEVKRSIGRESITLVITVMGGVTMCGSGWVLEMLGGTRYRVHGFLTSVLYA